MDILPVTGVGPATGDGHALVQLTDIGLPDLDPKAGTVGKPVLTPATADRVGLAVVAVSVTDIETAGAAAGGSGTVAIQVAGAVNVHHVVTEAHIDEGARINEDQTGAGADQSVNVNAGRTYHSLAVAGGLSLSGTVAVVPAVAVPILTGDTSAWIGRRDEFDARRTSGHGVRLGRQRSGERDGHGNGA